MTIRVGPLDLRRLAVRVESAVNAKRQDWDPADVLEFRRLARTLASPTDLRQWAKQWQIDGGPPKGIHAQYRIWLQTLADMQGLVNRNKPGSLRRHLRRLQKKGRPTFPEL